MRVRKPVSSYSISRCRPDTSYFAEGRCNIYRAVLESLESPLPPGVENTLSLRRQPWSLRQLELPSLGWL